MSMFLNLFPCPNTKDNLSSNATYLSSVSISINVHVSHFLPDWFPGPKP